MRHTLPSTAPLLWARVSPLVTAAWSRRMPRVKECRWGRSSRSTAASQAGRCSPWLPVIISANAVTCPAVALSWVLRALTWSDLGSLVVGEVVGVADDPPGYFPDGGRGQREHGSGERGAQRLHVAAR